MRKRPSVVIFTRKHVNVAALLASKMQRLSMLLIVMAFVLVGFNFSLITREIAVLFMTGFCVMLALLCTVGVTILDAVAWNFERLKQELRGEMDPLEIRELDREPTSQVVG